MVFVQVYGLLVVFYRAVVVSSGLVGDCPLVVESCVVGFELDGPIEFR